MTKSWESGPRPAATKLPGSKTRTEMCFLSASITRPRARATRFSDSPENSHPLPHSLQHFERLLQFIFRVRGGHDGSHPCFAFGDGGKCDAGSEHAFFEQLAGKIHGQPSVANDDGRDRRFACRSGLAADVEAEKAEFFLPEACVRPELLHPPRLCFENVESRNAGGRDRRRMLRQTQEEPHPLLKNINQITRAADVST